MWSVTKNLSNRSRPDTCGRTEKHEDANTNISLGNAQEMWVTVLDRSATVRFGRRFSSMELVPYFKYRTNTNVITEG